MQDSSTALTPVLQFRQDIHDRARFKIRQAIEEILEEELPRGARVGPARAHRGRRGYRHGARPRTVTTMAGTPTLLAPRCRRTNKCNARRARLAPIEAVCSE